MKNVSQSFSYSDNVHVLRQELQQGSEVKDGMAAEW